MCYNQHCQHSVKTHTQRLQPYPRDRNTEDVRIEKHGKNKRPPRQNQPEPEKPLELSRLPRSHHPQRREPCRGGKGKVEEAQHSLHLPSRRPGRRRVLCWVLSSIPRDVIQVKVIIHIENVSFGPQFTNSHLPPSLLTLAS